MKTKDDGNSRLKHNIEDASEMLKGLMDELRVQAHLGAMELEKNAGPYVDELMAATKDFVERGKQLQHQLKRIREQRHGG